MKIKARLILWFTLLVASIVFVFATVTYWSASKNRETEFFDQLGNEAITKAKLFLEAKVNSQTLHKIYQNNSEIINEVEVAVYDYDFNLLYHDSVEVDRVKETQELINTIIEQKQVKYFQGDWQVIGMLYQYNDKNYVLTAAALDQYGYAKLNKMLLSMGLMGIVSLVLIYFVGGFFAERILLPLKKMNDEVNSITATNLDLRISEDKNKDELGALADTFNEMLNRLENSFESQKQFVSNISHEIRTPLAAIIAELELALAREQDTVNYISTIQNALSDSKKLVRLSNSLLDFAKASYDPTEITFKQVRIDEIILDACQNLQKSNVSYKFNFIIADSVASEEDLNMLANPYLMEVAITNLLENACKFSMNEQCQICIAKENNSLEIRFTDSGIGISESDLEQIFKPFYRGVNKSYKEGNGIGLPLTKKIVELHKGAISVSSTVGQGTVFTILF